MIQKNVIQWFAKGFLATILILLIIIYPQAVQTQETGNSNAPFSEVSNSAEQADEVEMNNLALENEVDVTAVGPTDDPQGRVFIPLEETPINDSNIDAQEGVSSTDVPLSSAEAIEREKSLLETYTSPLVIPAADFADDGGNPDSSFFSFGSGYIIGNSQNYGCVMAPAYLPNNVTVTDMFATVYDNDATFNLTVSLRRLDNFTGVTDVMASGATLGDFDGIQVVSDFTIDEPLIAYPDYSYYVTTCALSSTIRFYSIRLYYTQS